MNYWLEAGADFEEVVEKLMILIGIATAVGLFVVVEACLGRMGGQEWARIGLEITEEMLEFLVVSFGVLFKLFYLVRVVLRSRVDERGVHFSSA